MGLVGGTFSYETSDWLSLGVASYGALHGERGGFITLGGAAALHKDLSPRWRLQTGIFVGAGGGRGGFTLQGSGLMLRYHLAGEYRSDDWGNFGLGLSYIDFPDGAIHSLQPYISYSIPFRTILPSPWQPASVSADGVDNWSGVRDAEQEFSLVYRYYNIPSKVVTDSGGPQNSYIGLMGAEWCRYFDDNLFLKIESEGAMQGTSNGYMQILMGGGYRLPILDTTWLKLSGALGVAGGGSVDTGGGLLVDSQAAIQQKLSSRLYAEFGAGYVWAPDASFEAVSLSGKLGYHFYTPDISYDRKRVSRQDLASYTPEKLRLRLAQQTYLQDDPHWRNHHVDQDVGVLGVQVDYFLKPYIYVTGQGLAAYDGMAGGYMTVLVGGGLHLPLFSSPLYVEGEMLVGAAGGGGLDVSGGFVWQTGASLGYDLTKSASLSGGYGYMSAPGGSFRAQVVSFALGYRFNLFVR